VSTNKRPPTPPERAKPSAANPAQFTRRQYIRYVDEQRRIRQIRQAIFVVAALCVAILLIPIVVNLLILPNQGVASVNGTTISRASYDKQRRWDIYNQVERLVYFSGLQNQGQAAATNPLDNPSVQQLISGMKKVSTDPLDSDSLEKLVEAELLRQHMGDFQISLNRAEVLSSTLKQYEPAAQPPTPSPTITATNSTTNSTTVSNTTSLTPTALTSTVPLSPTQTPTLQPTITPGGPPTQTPTPTATYIPVVGASATAEASYSKFLKDIQGSDPVSSGSSYCRYSCPNLSESDYYKIVAEPDYLRQQVTKKLEEKVPTSTLQLQLAQVLAADENEAKAALAEVQTGTDFATVAQKRSTDESTKTKGGDMGYTPAGVQTTEFDAAVFTPGRKAGDLIGPFKDSAGWHVVRVTAVQENRPLDGSQLSSLKGKVYDNWLANLKKSANISRSVQPTATSEPLPTLPPAPTVAPTDAPVITNTVSTSNTNQTAAATPKK